MSGFVKRRRPMTSSSSLSSPSLISRIPTPLAILLGVLLGILVSRSLPSLSSLSLSPSSSYTGSRSNHVPAYSSARGSSRAVVAIPSLEKRRRILELMTKLSPRYTKECTRPSQPLYADASRERYAPLVGHLITRPSSSWLSSLFGLPSAQQPILTSSGTELQPSSHKYFFAINLYNSFDVLPDLFSTLFRVSSILGFHNVFVSIYENGSTDQTKALLRIFSSLAASSNLRVTIRTSQRQRGAFNHRIEYLAEVRNAAFVPLHELRDAENEYFDTIVFMNDVLPCTDDLLELIFQSRLNNAGITCAADYMYHDDLSAPVFYDNWVARDVNGTALENAPFESIFHHGPSQERWTRHLPVQVQSCWNGIAVLDPAPFYTPPHTRFRMARITEGECSASECSLICNDYWEKGYGRIMMVPRVKLAYDGKVWDIVHPQRRDLEGIREFVRIGGRGDDPGADPQDRVWFGPHDRLFVGEEGEPLEFVSGPESVWCWGWDGAGDLDGPDVDPIWERMPNASTRPEAVMVRHDRSL